MVITGHYNIYIERINTNIIGMQGAYRKIEDKNKSDITGTFRVGNQAKTQDKEYTFPQNNRRIQGEIKSTRSYDDIIAYLDPQKKTYPNYCLSEDKNRAKNWKRSF